MCLPYYTPEALEVLREQMNLSEEAWMAIIAADPTGWRAMLKGDSEGK